LVKFDSEHKDSKLEFSKTLASIMINNLQDCLKTRASWIFVEMLEHANTKGLVLPDLKKEEKLIKELLNSKELKGNKGIQIILDQVQGKSKK
jgi:hypothetical protein